MRFSQKRSETISFKVIQLEQIPYLGTEWECCPWVALDALLHESTYMICVRSVHARNLGKPLKNKEADN
jgi:hypothetical protein